MAANSQSVHTGIWGASRSGKSHYMKHHAKQMRRAIVLDPTREYRDIGFTPVRTTAQLMAAVRKDIGAFQIAFEPSTDQSELLNWMAGYMFKLQQPFYEGKKGFPDMNFIVDEMSGSFPLHKENQSPNFKNMCSYGRHYGISLYGVSQFPAQVSTAFRAVCLKNVVFKQKSEANRKTAAALVDVSPADITALEEYQFFHDDDTGPAKKGKLP